MTLLCSPPGPSPPNLLPHLLEVCLHARFVFTVHVVQLLPKAPHDQLPAGKVFCCDWLVFMSRLQSFGEVETDVQPSYSCVCADTHARLICAALVMLPPSHSGAPIRDRTA
jgi:hypothetical protein